MTAAAWLAGALLALAGAADDPPIAWIADYSQAFEEASDRGSPFLLVIGRDGDRGCEAMLAAWKSKALGEIVKEIPCVLAWQGKEHPSPKPPPHAPPGRTRKDAAPAPAAGKTPPGECRYFPSVRCEDHERAFGITFPNFVRRQVYLPLHVLLDASGKEIVRKEGDLSEAALKKFLKEELSFLDKGLPRARYRELKGTMDAAARAAEAKDFAKAIEGYRSVASLDLPGGLAARAKKEIDALDRKGRVEVEDARRMADEGKAFEAIIRLRSLQHAFEGLPCAEAAGRALKEIRG